MYAIPSTITSGSIEILGKTHAETIREEPKSYWKHIEFFMINCTAKKKFWNSSIYGENIIESDIKKVSKNYQLKNTTKKSKRFFQVRNEAKA